MGRGPKGGKGHIHAAKERTCPTVVLGREGDADDAIPALQERPDGTRGRVELGLCGGGA